jgi:hypothetical protein
VSPRPPGRTQHCSAGDARKRLRDAEAQLDLAGLAGRQSSPEERKAAASCAVIAGIAASDAACCKALGERSRSQDHRDAVALLRQVAPGGREAARSLDRLLGLKDQAQYGFEDVSGQKLASALRQAHSLVAFARDVLAR